MLLIKKAFAVLALAAVLVCVLVLFGQYQWVGDEGDTDLNATCPMVADFGLDKICINCNILPTGDFLRRYPHLAVKIQQLILAQREEDFWQRCMADCTQNKLFELCQDLLQVIGIHV